MSSKAKPIIVVVVLAVFAVIVYDGQRKNAQQIEERDARCRQEQITPPPTFQKSADCILWSEPGTKQLPPQG